MNRLLWLIFLVALALRLGWTFHQPGHTSLPDEAEYLALGQNLLHTGQLSFFDARFDDNVLAYRMPLYPAFIAACGGSVLVTRIVQCVLDASLIFAVAMLTVRMGDRRARLLAAIAIALNPYLIFFSATLLSETLYTAMLGWGMALLAGRTRRSWWIGMTLLAGGILVRPSMIGLPIVLGLTGALLHPPRLPARGRIGPAAAAALMTLLVLTPWAIRNKLALDAWVITTTNSGITLYDGLNADADGSSDQSFLADMPWLNGVGELQRNQTLRDLARQFAADHPRRVAELAVTKLGRTWSPVPLSAEYGDRKHLIVGLAFTVPLFVFAIVGLWRGNLPRASKLWLLWPAIYISLAHAITIGSLRYRIPADVPLTVLAAVGVASLRRRRPIEPELADED